MIQFINLNSRGSSPSGGLYLIRTHQCMYTRNTLRRTDLLCNLISQLLSTSDIYTSNTPTYRLTTTTTMPNPFEIPVKTFRTRVPIIVQGGSHRHSVVPEVESAPCDLHAYPPLTTTTTTTTTSNSSQISVQNIRAGVPIVVQGGSHRRSVVLEMESVPCDLLAEPERDSRRDTIGREDFLQLRLPVVGLLNANEIDGILDAARGDSDFAIHQTPVVHNPVITSPTTSQQTNIHIAPIINTPANNLQRRPRTSRLAARFIASEFPALSVVSEEEDIEEEDENEAGVKPARKLAWRRGFRGIFRRGSGRI